MSAQPTTPLLYEPTPDEFEERVLPLSSIRRDEGQPRKTFTNIPSLAKSIQKFGLMNLIEVRRDPADPKKYLIIAGERRFRALVSLGCVKMKFKVYIGKKIDAYLRSMMENGQREPLNFIEEANSFAKFIAEHNPTDEELEVTTGYNIQTVRSRLELLKLSPVVQQMIQEKRLPQVSALGLAQYQNDLGAQIRMANELIATGVSLELQARAKKVRKVRTPETPDGQMSRVLQFVWRTRSVVPSIEALIADPVAFREVWMKLPTPARQNLIDQYGTIADTSKRLIDVIAAIDMVESAPPPLPTVPISAPPGPRPQPIPFPSSQRTSVWAPTPPPKPPARAEVNVGRTFVPPAPQGPPPSAARTREPIVITNQPPASLSIAYLPEGRLRSVRMVIQLLVGNPERHAKVNLSRGRLRSVYPCPDPEEAAIAALRTLWANWNEPSEKYRGEKRIFLEFRDKVRSDFKAKSFEEMVAKVWLQDQTMDPVNLALL